MGNPYRYLWHIYVIDMIQFEENTLLYPVPNDFFDVVLPKENVNTSKLILQVFRYTVGAGVREWLTTPKEIMRVTGIKSRSGLTTALLDAREKGYLIQRLLDDGLHTIALRPRYQDDPPDIPLARHGFVGDLSGYVYLIRRPDGCYKIGYSKEPAQRASNLAAEIGEPVDIVHTIECDDMPAAEEGLHRQHARYHATGEWYALPVDAVTAITRTIRYVDGRWLKAKT